MAHELHKVRISPRRLNRRREPYWGADRFGRGRALGYRKIDAERGSWIARMRNETGRKVYKSLGYAEGSFDYDKAKEAAAGMV